MTSSKNHGGKREKAGRKLGSGERTPRDLMNEMGFPAHWLTPVQFCMAVMNNDVALLKYKPREEQKGAGKGNGNRPITIGQRIEAARIATPYLHQKLPEIVDLNPGDSWATMLREAEERERKMMSAHENRTTH